MEIERLCWLCRVTLDREKITIVDTGKGMDSTTENSIAKWYVLCLFWFYSSYVCSFIVWIRSLWFFLNCSELVYRGTIGSSTNREHIGEAIGGEPPYLKVCQWQPPYSDRLSLSCNYELELMELAASQDLNITVTAKFLFGTWCLQPHFGMYGFGGIGAGLHLGGWVSLNLWIR